MNFNFNEYSYEALCNYIPPIDQHQEIIQDIQLKVAKVDGKIQPCSIEKVGFCQEMTSKIVPTDYAFASSTPSHGSIPSKAIQEQSESMLGHLEKLICD